jgi:hypothetical protein
MNHYWESPMACKKITAKFVKSLRIMLNDAAAHACGDAERDDAVNLA